ncbi:uncharacterized protein LOC115398480 isoform X2 [Salarias fasciatus]|nr:uncharacterized protein LOC115398480 isoform X2 [Salarias fasciatus]
MAITQLNISLNKAEEEALRARGFKMVEGNLTQGTQGNEVHLWHKDGHGNNITRIQFSYAAEMEKGFLDAGYMKIDKNIDAGTYGPEIYLWYIHGHTAADVAIKDLHLSMDANDEAQMLQAGFERLTCDLNYHTGGNRVFLWLEREKPVYIKDIKGTTDWSSDVTLLKEGYTRSDSYINKYVVQERVYIWYLNTTDQQDAIKDLQLSHNPQEYTNLQNQGYSAINMDLSQGTTRKPVFLWFKKDGFAPIRSMGVITDRAVKEYEKVGSVTRKMFSLEDFRSLASLVTFYLYFLG